MDWKMATTCDARQVIEDVVAGKNRATDFCQHFAPVVFAVALKRTGRLDDAHACLEPVLKTLLHKLAGGRLESANWEDELISETLAWNDERWSHEDKTGESNDEAGLASFSTLPRIARRRALRAQLIAFELPQLIVAILTYCIPLPDGSPPSLAEIGALVNQSPEVTREQIAKLDSSLRTALNESGEES